LWPTPRTTGLDGGSNSRKAAKARGRWPTPTSTMWKGPSANPESMAGHGLAAAVRWPTPTARDHKDGQYNPNVPINGLLGRAVWPTPRAQNGEGRNSKVWLRETGPQNLENALATADPSLVGGSLNPTWVEWLMGFPLGWTDLGPSATRSSRRSSK
jgi:DNA (cytosine-5)-methyltransferase 1